MQSISPDFFRYCRDKGAGFGHGSRKRNPGAAWEEVKKFLNKHTVYDKVTLVMRINNRANECDPSIYTEMLMAFGEPDIKSGNKLCWSIDFAFNDKVNEVISRNILYICDGNSSVSLCLNYKFYWRLPLSSSVDGDIFKYFNTYGYHGFFTIYVDEKLFIQPEFIVPVVDWESFHKFNDVLVADLPFKFSKKSYVSFKRQDLKNGKKRYKAIGNYGG